MSKATFNHSLDIVRTFPSMRESLFRTSIHLINLSPVPRTILVCLKSAFLLGLTLISDFNYPWYQLCNLVTMFADSLSSSRPLLPTPDFYHFPQPWLCSVPYQFPDMHPASYQTLTQCQCLFSVDTLCFYVWITYELLCSPCPLVTDIIS